jgi:hypothetical protein
MTVQISVLISIYYSKWRYYCSELKNSYVLHIVIVLISCNAGYKNYNMKVGYTNVTNFFDDVFQNLSEL